MARQAYQPPKQGTAGMVVDALLMLVLLFAALKAPAWIAEWRAGEEAAAPAAEAAATEAAPPAVQWSDLGQNATMQTAWEKLGKDPAAAKAIIDNKFDYSINVFKLLSVAALVAFYFFYMLTNSFKEYRDVIEERFGNGAERSGDRKQRTGG